MWPDSLQWTSRGQVSLKFACVTYWLNSGSWFNSSLSETFRSGFYNINLFGFFLVLGCKFVYLGGFSGQGGILFWAVTFRKACYTHATAFFFFFILYSLIIWCWYSHLSAVPHHIFFWFMSWRFSTNFCVGCELIALVKVGKYYFYFFFWLILNDF